MDETTGATETIARHPNLQAIEAALTHHHEHAVEAREDHVADWLCQALAAVHVARTLLGHFDDEDGDR
ncbi:MAG: hypothetical protein AB7G37_06360 [Solirubrobacteraceae bacterium]